MSLLEIDNVVKEYDLKTILGGVSLRVDRGARVALVGSNGAGKTTLLRIICGIERPDQGRVCFATGTRTGYLSQNLDDMAALNETPFMSPELSELEKELKRLEMMMAQGNTDAISTYERITAKFEAMGGYSLRYRMAETLSGLGLPNDTVNRPVSSFSGGERMRVALARLLVMEPDILLLDEPTNHLDLEGVEWLEEYLRSFKGGVLVVSHDRYFLDRVASRVAVIENGALRLMSGGYTDFVIQTGIEREFEEKELQRLKQEVVRQQETAQTLRSHRKMASYHSRQKVVAKLSEKLSELRERTKGRNNTSMKLSISASEGYSREVLSFVNLTKSYDDKIVFSDISLRIKAGDKVALVGQNGCGKTTLINLLMGRDSGFTGQLTIGNWVRVGHMGQNVNFSTENATMLEEVMATAPIDEDAARKHLAAYGFRNKDVFKEINVLSGGERSRLFLACMLLENPDCLVLDEPTNHLDTQSREILEDAILSFNGTVIAASHDRYFLGKCFTRIVAFINGSIKEYQSYESFKSSRDIIRRIPDRSIKPIRSDDKKKERVARTEERRISAARRARAKELENEIKILEENKTLLENSFNKETALSEYEEYNRMISRIESAYAEYIELEEDL